METEMTSKTGTAARRIALPALLAALALLMLIWPPGGVSPAAAQQPDETSAAAADRDASGLADDPYLDPLAFQRVNTEAQNLPLVIEYAATGEMRTISGRYLLSGSREMYVRSAAAAGIFKASRFWQSALRRLEFKVADKTFTVTGDSRLVITPEGELLLPVPVLDHEGDLWLPLVLLEEVIGPQISERLSWDPVARRLHLGTAVYNVTGLSSRILGRTTEVTITCTEPLGFRTTSPQSGVIDLKIYGGQVNTSAVGTTHRRGLLHGARSRQYRDNCLVTLQVDQLVGRYRTYTSDGGRRIVVVLEEEQVSALPEPVPLGQQNVNIATGPVDTTHDIRIRTVVVDPGHGGHDVGAVGRRGILEKDVNLAVARELRRYLERESDLKVVLTRDGDDHVDLQQRAEIADLADGDLFVSLHCNSWFNDGAQGLETYFLSPAQSDWARSVEAAENQAGAATPETDDVAFIVWDLVQNSFISHSSQLAEIVQERTCAGADLQNRGVRQAGFRVLVGAHMPAVLVEMGFLSHAEEEERLGDSRFQRRLARALGESLLAYRDLTELAAAQGDTTTGDTGGDTDDKGGGQRDDAHDWDGDQEPTE